jgi:hypothetical protein
MTAVNAQETITVSLSLEEVLTVLNVLETSSIPGLAAETWASLSSEQQDLALSVARRALEARGWAQTDDNGQLLIHRALLTAVGICAFPQRSILVDQWSPDGQATSLYAHTRDNDRVVHTQTRGVHTFVLLPSEDALVQHLASVCKWNSGASATSLELTIPRQDFTQACDASADGAEAEALKILTRAGGAEKASSALAHALATSPRISIVQMVSSNDGQSAQERSFTFIESNGSSWLVAPVTEDENAPLKAHSSTGSEVSTLLQKW